MNPFLSEMMQMLPNTLNESFNLCKFLYNYVPVYATAYRKIIRYFIQDIVSEDHETGSSSERKKWIKYLKNDFKVFEMICEAGDGFACYGNSFIRLVMPFDRFLFNQEEFPGKTFAVSTFANNPEADLKFDTKSRQYKAKVPRAGKVVTFDFYDSPSSDRKRIKYKSLDPKYVTIEPEFWTGDQRIIYRFETEYKNSIKRGDLFQINSTPKKMLLAVLDDNDYRFEKDAVFHFKQPTLPGMTDYQWGVPPILERFSSLMMWCVYKQVDEAVAREYLVPYRVISPASGNTPAGSNTNWDILDRAEFKQAVKEMVNHRKKDLKALYSFPIPLSYTEMNSEGKRFATKELQEYQLNEILDSLGVPLEMFRTTLDIQQMPTAIRLFESLHLFIQQAMNDLLQWASSRISKYLMETDIPVRLESPTIANDLDKQGILLQLGLSGEIPREMYMRGLKILDPVQARKDRDAEDLEVEKNRMEIEQAASAELEGQQMLLDLGMQANESMPDGQGHEGTNPFNIEDKAQMMAEEWLQLPVGDRQKAMQQAAHTDRTTYALAKQIKEEIERNAESQGRQQLQQQ